MVQGFFNAICQMGIFMVCAQAIVHFRPDGSYEKYLRMLVSVMILVQIFIPITRLFSPGVQKNMDDTVKELQRKMETGMEEAKAFSDVSDSMLERMTLEEIKTQLNNIGFREEEMDSGEPSPVTESYPDPSSAAGSGQDSAGRETSDSEIAIDPVKIEIGGE